MNNSFCDPFNNQPMSEMSNQNFVTDITHDEIARIKCNMTRDMATAVLECGLWDTVRDFEGQSFMFHGPEDINNLDNHPLVDMYYHSGASFALCLRNVQFIGKNGVDAFNTLYDTVES